jgi:Ribbon-helix-helix protein, copG family
VCTSPTAPLPIVRVEPEVKKRLEKLAKSTGRTRSFLAAEAINEYLEINEWQVAGIKRCQSASKFGSDATLVRSVLFGADQSGLKQIDICRGHTFGARRA